LTCKKQTEPPNVLTASKPVDTVDPQLTKDVQNAALLDERLGAEGHSAEGTKPSASSQIPKNSYIYKIINKPSTDFTYARADDACDSSTTSNSLSDLNSLGSEPSEADSEDSRRTKRRKKRAR
jgi:hypothetical protein